MRFALGCDAIERQDYHYPTLDRMKLGVQDGRE